MKHALIFLLLAAVTVGPVRAQEQPTPQGVAEAMLPCLRETVGSAIELRAATDPSVHTEIYAAGMNEFSAGTIWGFVRPAYEGEVRFAHPHYADIVLIQPIGDPATRERPTAEFDGNGGLNQRFNQGAVYGCFAASTYP
jgi:hypothetical protein